MRSFKALIFLSASGMLFLSSAALAQPRADLNGDGTVTKAEFTTHSKSKFAKADLDLDGVWSASERKAMREARQKERANIRFAKLDQNSDGIISKAELEAIEQNRADKRNSRRMKRLKMIDTDGDGNISQAEKEAAIEKRRARRAEKRDARKTKTRMRHMRLDSDKNGLISQQEFMAHADALFTRMDTNGDGVLTKGEGRKARHKKQNKKRF